MYQIFTCIVACKASDPFIMNQKFNIRFVPKGGFSQIELATLVIVLYNVCRALLFQSDCNGSRVESEISINHQRNNITISNYLPV